MQLTQFTDYALRVLIYTAVKQDTCTITEIANSYGISRNHLVKIVHKLGQLDVLKTVRGKQGGITLNQAPEKINLGELVKQIEPHFHIVECFDADRTERCPIEPACQLKQILYQARQNFFDTLSQYTLADITHNSSQLSQFLNIDIEVE